MRVEGVGYHHHLERPPEPTSAFRLQCPASRAQGKVSRVGGVEGFSVRGSGFGVQSSGLRAEFRELRVWEG